MKFTRPITLKKAAHEMSDSIGSSYTKQTASINPGDGKVHLSRSFEYDKLSKAIVKKYLNNEGEFNQQKFEGEYNALGDNDKDAIQKIFKESKYNSKSEKHGDSRNAALGAIRDFLKEQKQHAEPSASLESASASSSSERSSYSYISA